MFAENTLEICAFLCRAFQPSRIRRYEFDGDDFGSLRGGHASSLKQKGPDLHRGLFAFGFAC
jgi:hypothetical protein